MEFIALIENMKTAKKIQVLYKPEGIRIIIKPDYYMQLKWQRFFGGNFTLADTIRENIPGGLFSDDPIKFKEKIFYFNCREQAQDIAIKIILHFGLLNKSKNLKFWTLIYDLCANNKLYIKAVTQIGTRSDSKLKTMFLSGDESTGLINNL
jgi:hypothetical protein